MRRLYDSSMYRFARPVPSYWEATAGEVSLRASPIPKDDSCDVAIIGGGYTGLSAACHLSRDYDLDVRVLEAGQIGWGASGRNGGFCSVGGSKMDAREMSGRFGVEATRQYYQSQVNAVELVRDLIIHENIDTPMQGDRELEVAWSRRSFDKLRQDAEELHQAFGLDTAVLSADQFRERFFDCSEQFGGSALRPTFGLHPLRFIKGLAAAAEKYGAVLYPLSEVIDWSRQNGQHRLETRVACLRARYVVMACNGFMPEDLHPAFRGRPLPMISAILVTRPLSEDELASYNFRTECPAITSRDLLNYFRVLPDRRLMFGGRGYSNGSEGGNEKTYQLLAKRLHTLWPRWTDVGIEYRWNGLICMTMRRTPSIGRLADDPSVFFGFGYHGNGVNTAVWTGKQIADWLGAAASGQSGFEDRLPVMVRGLSGRFPFPALRLYYLKARIALYRLQELVSGIG